MISERYKTLIKLQRVLVITGFAMGVLLVVVVLREGIFSTTSLIMYGIVLLYVAIATHISISDVLTRDKNMLDKEELD
ncbi:hypothetical protein OA107_03435 [Candidatus Pelagibacter sp.]|nr:hypothetical protein [Candidatus Pelagibacter sp.]